MLHKSFRYPVLAVCIASLCLISGLTVAQHATAALTTFETDDFSGSGVCAFCHSRLRDEAGNDVSNDAQWRSTMMANAAKDPLWQAKISAEIDTSSFSPNQSLFGPYNRPARNPIQRNTGFLPTDHAPDRQLSDSAHCGSCRTLCTPSLTADGTYIKAFPEQTTYLEWEHSQFDLTCQDCRLPEAVGSAVISNRPRRLAARSPFGQHHYVGGNSYMINLLKTHAANLGVTADATHLDATVSRTLAQLQQNTATVTATASLTDTGDRLQVTVDVTNLAGHKFPSGLPSRRAWLHVTVSDIGEDIIFESGRPFENGSIEGNDADINMADFLAPLR